MLLGPNREAMISNLEIKHYTAQDKIEETSKYCQRVDESHPVYRKMTKFLSSAIDALSKGETILDEISSNAIPDDRFDVFYRQALVHYNNAINLALIAGRRAIQVKVHTRRERDKREFAKDLIQRAKSAIENAAARGIPTSDLIEGFNRAEVACRAGDYAKTDEIVRKIKRSIEKRKEKYHKDRKRAYRMIGSLKKRVHEAKQKGVDINRFVHEIDRLRQLFNKSAFSEVVQASKRLRDRLDDSIAQIATVSEIDVAPTEETTLESDIDEWMVEEPLKATSESPPAFHQDEPGEPVQPEIAIEQHLGTKMQLEARARSEPDEEPDQASSKTAPITEETSIEPAAAQVSTETVAAPSETEPAPAEQPETAVVEKRASPKTVAAAGTGPETRVETSEEKEEEARPADERGVNICPICDQIISHDPSFKCDCGEIFHDHCADRSMRCPVCDGSWEELAEPEREPSPVTAKVSPTAAEPTPERKEKKVEPEAEKEIPEEHGELDIAHEVRKEREAVATVAAGEVEAEAEAEAESTAPAQPQPYKIVEATANERCKICFGIILPGSKLLECNCGKSFHEHCALRMGKCPACQADFGVETEEEFSDEDLLEYYTLSEEDIVEYMFKCPACGMMVSSNDVVCSHCGNKDLY